MALRDVGAQLSIRFPRQRVVKTLLDGGTPAVIPEAEPDTKKKVEVAKTDVPITPKPADVPPSFVEGGESVESDAQSDVEAIDTSELESDEKNNPEVSDEA